MDNGDIKSITYITYINMYNQLDMTFDFGASNFIPKHPQFLGWPASWGRTVLGELKKSVHTVSRFISENLWGPQLPECIGYTLGMQMGIPTRSCPPVKFVGPTTSLSIDISTINPTITLFTKCHIQISLLWGTTLHGLIRFSWISHKIMKKNYEEEVPFQSIGVNICVQIYVSM